MNTIDARNILPVGTKVPERVRLSEAGLQKMVAALPKADSWCLYWLHAEDDTRSETYDLVGEVVASDGDTRGFTLATGLQGEPNFSLSATDEEFAGDMRIALRLYQGTQSIELQTMAVTVPVPHDLLMDVVQDEIGRAEFLSSVPEVDDVSSLVLVGGCATDHPDQELSDGGIGALTILAISEPENLAKLSRSIKACEARLKAGLRWKIH